MGNSIQFSPLVGAQIHQKNNKPLNLSIVLQPLPHVLLHSLSSFKSSFTSHGTPRGFHTWTLPSPIPAPAHRDEDGTEEGAGPGARRCRRFRSGVVASGETNFVPLVGFRVELSLL